MPELTYDEMQELLGSRATARGFAEADDYWAKREREKRLTELDTADRLAAVREISTKALYHIVLAVLEAHDGCSLDSVADRERVACSLITVLSQL